MKTLVMNTYFVLLWIVIVILPCQSKNELNVQGGPKK